MTERYHQVRAQVLPTVSTHHAEMESTFYSCSNLGLQARLQDQEMVADLYILSRCCVLSGDRELLQMIGLAKALSVGIGELKNMVELMILVPECSLPLSFSL